MHEPLFRNMRIRDDANATLLLTRACVFVVILAVALVGIALIAGEVTVGRPDQIAAAAKQTTGSAMDAPNAAPSSNDLFSGMPLP